MKRLLTIRMPIICALMVAAVGLMPAAVGSAKVLAKGLASVRWSKLLLPGDGQAKVIAISRSGRPTAAAPMFLGGSLTKDVKHRPALWKTIDGVTFEPIPIDARPGYGTECEIFSVASIGEQVAAVCQAFGGAHGNARTSAFARVGLSAPLTEIAASFELYNGVRQISVRSVVTTGNGFAIFGSRVNQNGQLGATSWTTSVSQWSEPAGPEFVIHDADVALSSNGKEQVQGLGIASDGSGGVIGVGERLWWRPNAVDPSTNDTDTDAMLWRSANAETWERWSGSGLKLDGRLAQRMQTLRVVDGVLVAAGTQVNANQVELVVWTPSGRRVVPSVGATDDVLSAPTDILGTGQRVFIGARIGTNARLVESNDNGRTFFRREFPAGTPVGTRSRVTLADLDANRLLVSASSEAGGSLFVLTVG
jgi:hypothetical protein